ncbi:MAG: hypothetical protein ACM31C_04235 [Acidobacteriota bacterium]
MSKLSCVFLAALSLAAFGCKKKGGDCAAAIDHSMALSKPMLEKMPGNTPETIQKMKDLGVQHCKDDHWSTEAITCMTEAKTMADAQVCYGKLSQAQRDTMNKAAMDMTPAGSAAPAAPK